MSAAIVLPPLKTWAEQHLTALIIAKTKEDFDQAFDNFIAKNVKISFNGESLTRDNYKEKLQSERFDEVGAVVKVLNSIQAPVLNTQETQVCTILKEWIPETLIACPDSNPGWSGYSTMRHTSRESVSAMRLSSILSSRLSTSSTSNNIYECASD